MNMAVLRTFSLTIAGVLLIFSVTPGNAAEKYTGRTYNQKLVKSRADQGYTNRGTIIYNYSEIDSYDDGLEGEEIGNIKVDPKVREIHNVVIVHDDVQSSKDELAVGQLDIDKPHANIEIKNEVIIDGDVNAAGESMEIGTVRMGKGGKSKKVDNSVQIKGGIDAR